MEVEIEDQLLQMGWVRGMKSVCEYEYEKKFSKVKGRWHRQLNPWHGVVRHWSALLGMRVYVCVCVHEGRKGGGGLMGVLQNQGL